MNARKKRWPWIVTGTVLLALAVGAAFGSTYFASLRRFEREDAYFERLQDLARGIAGKEPLPSSDLAENATREQAEKNTQDWLEYFDRVIARAEQQHERLIKAWNEGYDPGPKYDFWMLGLFVVFGGAAGYCYYRAYPRIVTGWSYTPDCAPSAICSTEPGGRRTYRSGHVRAAWIAILGFVLLAVFVCVVLPNIDVVRGSFAEKDGDGQYYFFMFILPGAALAAIAYGLLGLYRPKVFVIDPAQRRVFCGRGMSHAHGFDYADVRLVIVRTEGPRATGHYRLYAFLPGFNMLLRSELDEDTIRGEAEEIRATTNLEYEYGDTPTS